MLLPIDGKRPAKEGGRQEDHVKAAAQVSLANSPDTFASAMAPKPDGLGKFQRVCVGQKLSFSSPTNDGPSQTDGRLSAHRSAP
jgi:hypothetical protein